MRCYLTVCQTQQSAKHIPNHPPSFPAILPPAWRDEVQLNTPISVDNEAGREEHLLNMGANYRWVFGEAHDSSHCHADISEKLD